MPAPLTRPFPHAAVRTSVCETWALAPLQTLSRSGLQLISSCRPAPFVTCELPVNSAGLERPAKCAQEPPPLATHWAKTSSKPGPAAYQASWGMFTYSSASIESQCLCCTKFELITGGRASTSSCAGNPSTVHSTCKRTGMHCACMLSCNFAVICIC